MGLPDPPLCAPPQAEFSIWTREAGAGGLSIAVEGPSKAEIAFEDRKDGSCGVSYVVQEPGTGTGGRCRATRNGGARRSRRSDRVRTRGGAAEAARNGLSMGGGGAA